MARFLSSELCIDTDQVVTVRPAGSNWRADEWLVEVEAEEGGTTPFLTSRDTALALLQAMNEEQRAAHPARSEAA
jgi:hypothetical protein